MRLILCLIYWSDIFCLKCALHLFCEIQKVFHKKRLIWSWHTLACSLLFISFIRKTPALNLTTSYNVPYWNYQQIRFSKNKVILRHTHARKCFQCFPLSHKYIFISPEFFQFTVCIPRGGLLSVNLKVELTDNKMQNLISVLPVIYVEHVRLEFI